MGRILLILVSLLTLVFGVSTATAADLDPDPDRVVLVNEPFECTSPIDLELVRVTISNGMNADAIGLETGCTGTIDRIEVTTNGPDGVKIRPGSGGGPHDMVIGGGFVFCTGAPAGAHQDGMQSGGGRDITFYNVAFGCGGNSDFFTTGWNGQVSTRIVCVHCALTGASLTVIERQPASTLFMALGSGNGARDSRVCEGKFPNLTVRIGPGATNPVTENLEVVRKTNPAYASLCSWAAALAFVGDSSPPPPPPPPPPGEPACAPTCDEQIAALTAQLDEILQWYGLFPATGRRAEILAWHGEFPG